MNFINFILGVCGLFPAKVKLLINRVRKTCVNLKLISLIILPERETVKSLHWLELLSQIRKNSIRIRINGKSTFDIDTRTRKT